jgi:hypothetical protein
MESTKQPEITMTSQQLREQLQEQRDVLNTIWKKDYDELFDKYIKLQSEYNLLLTDINILSKAYNELVVQTSTDKVNYTC